METPCVAHLLRRYLPVTQRWIYDQIVNAPGVRHVVLAQNPETPERFPLGAVYFPQSRPLFLKAAHRLASALSPGSLPWQRAVLRKTGARILHCHFGDVGCEAAPLKEKLGLPMVVSFYGFDATGYLTKDPSLKERYRSLGAKADRFLVEGGAMARRLATFGIPEEKIVVQRLGVRLEEFRFRERSWDGAGRFRILLAARFQEKKGIPCAIAAAAMLKNRLDCELHVAGGPDASPESRKEEGVIQTAARQSGLGDRLTFHGFLSIGELSGLMETCHVLIAPSATASNGDAEGGFPTILTAAAAIGMPMAATRHCDIPEIVAHGKTGWLAEERDAEGLAAGLERIASDRALAARLARNARAHVEKEYNAAAQGKKLERIYRTLCD